MTEMNDAIFNSKPALPNKLLQEDGTITDITGATVVNAVDAYNAKPALPNKFLNPDGTYSTLNEIIASMVDTDIYVLVDELPEEGNPQKIYIVPNGDGTFNEYRWTGSTWDNIGMLEFDLSDYYNKTEIDSNFLKKTNTTVYTPTQNYHPATKKYVDDNSTTFKPFPNTFVTNSTTTTFLASIVAQNLPVGMAYLGQVSLSDMPDGVTVQAEVEVYIYPQNVAYCVMRSADVAPYIWEVNSYDNRGWEPLAPSGGNSTPQVFYWDGVTTATTANLAFWNDILTVLATKPVIVYRNYTYKTIHYVLSWYFHDTLPTSLSANEATARNVQLDGTMSSGYMVGHTCKQSIAFTITNGEIVSMYNTNPSVIDIKYLDAGADVGGTYVPTYNNSPASKKYVDDSITTNITNVLGGSY